MYTLLQNHKTCVEISAINTQYAVTSILNIMFDNHKVYLCQNNFSAFLHSSAFQNSELSMSPLQ